MIQLKIIINIEATNLLLEDTIYRFKNKLLDQLSKNTKILFEKNTPKMSGKASRNYRIIKSSNQHEVVNNSKYLPWVNDGTGLYGPLHHRITPKHAKVLHFHWRGREWFLKSVRGQKGQRFVERSMVEVVQSVESAVVIASRGTLA